MHLLAAKIARSSDFFTGQGLIVMGTSSANARSNSAKAWPSVLAETQILTEIDGQLGSVIAELKTLGRWERTRLYITADHGFDPLQTSHNTDASNVFLVTNDPDVGTATYAHQIPWTIYRNYGIKADDYPAPVEAM